MPKKSMERPEHFDVLWYGAVGRRFRYAALFIAILPLMFGVLAGITSGESRTNGQFAF